MDLAKSNALHARARAFVAAFERGDPAPEAFDVLACDIARYQIENSEGYARLVRARGLDPKMLVEATALPPVPTDAFKLTRVATFDEAETKTVFRTSGTTIGARGSHPMRDEGVATYDAAAVAYGRRWLMRDLEERVPVIVLGPSPDDAPDSSLVHMCAAFAAAFGSSVDYVIEGDIIDVSRFDERVAYALTDERPMLVLATSFALVHFIEGMDDVQFRLPARSRVMQTGGFKGKSREVEPHALRAEVARIFAIPSPAIIGEYGMTELTSQFYEERENAYVEPPWARVIPVDPDTLEPVEDGEVGIAKIIDLMNVDSAVAVLASDRVRRIAGGFELLGRQPGAAPRGCSIAIDEILGRS